MTSLGFIYRKIIFTSSTTSQYQGGSNPDQQHS